MTSFTGKYEASEVGIEITLDEKTMNEEEGLMATKAEKSKGHVKVCVTGKRST